MSGVILALVEHLQSALQVLSAARNLAALMGAARINVLAIRVPPESTIMPTEEVLTTRQASDIRFREQERVSALHVLFDEWASTVKAPMLVVEWVDIEGLVEPLVGEWGRRSDFLVVNRLSRHDPAPNRLALQAALFDTDRPVLMVPPGPAANFGERVAIAWRDDKRTDRAVLAALRLLPQAKQVHVLAGVRAGQNIPVLPEILAEHGVDAVLNVLPIGAAVFGQALLAEAHKFDADLLVMGAYTHSPWRELILGGVTKYMLAHADLPVLIRH
jgi:nucleotide-binding universal stress UspA family protein